MVYDPTEWKSRIVEFPNRFRLISLGDDLYTILPEPGTITEYGTLVNEENMNKIEQGIYDANLWATDSGGDDAYVLDLATTFRAGLVLPIKISIGNTGAATLSIDNGATTKEIRKNSASGPVALATGDMKPGVHILVSDGTYWILTASVDANTLDGLHASDFIEKTKGSVWMAPSDDIILESLAEKSVTLSGSMVIMKSFLVHRPGKYRVTFEAKTSNASIPFSIYWFPFENDLAGSGELVVSSVVTASTNIYTAFSLDLNIEIPHGGYLGIVKGTHGTSTTAFVRNARLKGAESTRPIDSVVTE